MSCTLTEICQDDGRIKRLIDNNNDLLSIKEKERKSKIQKRSNHSLDLKIDDLDRNCKIQKKSSYSSDLKIDELRKSFNCLDLDYKKIDGNLSPKNIIGTKSYKDGVSSLITYNKRIYENIDFEFYGLSFPRIFSERSKRNITMQLNMCFDTYHLINEIVKFVISKNKGSSKKEIKEKCYKELMFVMEKWSEERKDSYGKDFKLDELKNKGDYLLKHYFHFKKSLNFELQKVIF